MGGGRFCTYDQYVQVVNEVGSRQGTLPREALRRARGGDSIQRATVFRAGRYSERVSISEQGQRRVTGRELIGS